VKILAVSDMVVDRLYSEQLPNLFPGVEMVLGCGDLPYEYLEFLVTALNVPLLYVPGNHDPLVDEHNPRACACGCDLLDRRVVHLKGLTLAGLGGSIRYTPGTPNQHTQSEMYLRLFSLLPALLARRLRSRRPLDIMLAHSPPYGIHDEEDPAHTGFKAFRLFLSLVKPRYFLHGHTLVYKGNLQPPLSQVESTTIINVYPYRVLEIAPHV
jgi:uncharacterized protein